MRVPAWHWAQAVGSHLTPVSTRLRRILIPPETQAQTEPPKWPLLTAAELTGEKQA